jgi:hypothetical protein
VVTFVIAMALGSVIPAGRSGGGRLGDPWLIVLLNLPALLSSLAYAGPSPRPRRSRRWR